MGLNKRGGYSFVKLKKNWFSYDKAKWLIN
jgi:hypothetical protein